MAFSGSSATVRYNGYANTSQNVYGLILRGGSGGNRITINNPTASQTLSRILAGTGSDTINVLGTGLQGITIRRCVRYGPVAVGGATIRGMQNIFGSVFVGNTSGMTNLILDDSGDTNRSDIIVRADQILGLAPAAILLDPRHQVDCRLGQ